MKTDSEKIDLLKDLARIRSKYAKIENISADEFINSEKEIERACEKHDVTRDQALQIIKNHLK